MGAWAKEKVLGEARMTAFERAWGLIKMPMYHGTSKDAWERIQREGLKPTMYLDYDEIDDDTDYAFAHGDRGYPHPYSLGPGGSASAITHSLAYADPEFDLGENETYDGEGVVLEIGDDAPGWHEQPTGMSGGGPYKFQAGRDIRLNADVTPPEFIRRVGPEEINDALRRYKRFREAEEKRRKLMFDLEWKGGKSDEDREAFSRLMYGKGGFGNNYSQYIDNYNARVAKPYWPVSYEQKVKWSEYPDQVRRN